MYEACCYALFSYTINSKWKQVISTHICIDITLNLFENTNNVCILYQFATLCDTTGSPHSWKHYNDVIMSTIASQIISLAIVYSTVYSDANQRKHQSSAPLAFVRGIHRGPVNSPHKWPVTRKMFPFDDVIMCPGSQQPWCWLLSPGIFRFRHKKG